MPFARKIAVRASGHEKSAAARDRSACDELAHPIRPLDRKKSTMSHRYGERIFLNHQSMTDANRAQRICRM